MSSFRNFCRISFQNFIGENGDTQTRSRDQFGDYVLGVGGIVGICVSWMIICCLLEKLHHLVRLAVRCAQMDVR